MIFENCTGIAVDDISPDDDVNEAFRKMDGNIAELEWGTEPLEAKPTETEPIEAIIHNNQYMPLPYNNQYVPLAENYEDNEDNNESTGVEEKNTGGDNNND